MSKKFENDRTGAHPRLGAEQLRAYLNRTRRAACVGLIAVSAGCSGAPADEHFGESAQALFPSAGSLSLQGSFASTSKYSVVASTGLTGARFATAGRMTATGRLGINLWRVNSKTEAPEAISAFISTSLVADKVSVARVDDAHFVVAFRNSAGKYDVISFVIDSANDISQATELVASSITDISVTSVNAYLGPLDQDANGGAITQSQFGDGHVLVAYRGFQNKLGLESYSVDMAGTLTGRGSMVDASPISKVAVTWVPGSQPRNVFHSRLTSGSENTAATCTDGIDNDGDGYTDCEDWNCCDVAACDGQGACSQGQVVTVTTTTSNAVSLTTWGITAGGVMTKIGTTAVGSGSAIDIAASSFHRVATIRTDGGQPLIETWDIGMGAPVLHSHYSPAVNATDVQIERGGGARLFAEFSSAGTGYLQTLNALDTLRAEERIQLPGTNWSKIGRMSSITPDRVELSWPASDDGISVESYRDFNIPIVHGSLYVPPANDATGNVVQSPVVDGDTNSFNPLWGSVGGARVTLERAEDSSVSVGEDDAMVCGNGYIEIFDRQGTRVRNFTAKQVFANLIDPAQPLQNLNRVLQYQNECDPTLAPNDLNRCPNAFFDMRCSYDDVDKRHVITTTLRFSPSGPGKDYSQRYFAMAVSTGPHAIDGFRTYISTNDGKMADNPSIDTAGGNLSVGYHADGNKEHFNYPSETLEPSVMVFSVGDLSAGTQDVWSTKLAKWQTNSTDSTASIGVSRGGVQKTFVFNVTASRLNYYMLGTAHRGFNDLVSGTITFRNQNAIENQVPFLSLSAPASAAPGHLYVPQLFRGAFGEKKARMLDVALTVTPSAIAALPDVAVVGTGCVNPQSCVRPSVAADAKVATLVFGEFTQGYYACAASVACTSKVCSGSPTGACVASTSALTPRWRYNQYAVERSNAQLGSAVLAKSPFMDFSASDNGSSFFDDFSSFIKTWTTSLDPNPSANHSVWTINTLKNRELTSTASWDFFVGRTPGVTP